MTTRVALSVVFAALMMEGSAIGQTPASGPVAERYIDPVNGLSLQQAISRALDQEPSIRAARAEIDVARGMRLQASLRPNPNVSFERRKERGGADNQTMVALEWPLDLFRKSPRVALAEREIAVTELAVADRERLLAAEARMRYGEVVAALRDVAILDELVATTRRQHQLLRSRVDEGATPPLERDLLDVEVRRLESERLLQAGRLGAAVFALKRVLGMSADADLTIRDTLEDLVRRESTTAATESVTSAVLDQRADVREAASRVAVAEAKVERAQAEGRFDISLLANYMRMDAGFPQRGVNAAGGLEPIRGVFHYFSGGAMITVPLLNRNEGEVAAAKAERTGAELTATAARLAAEAELAAARTRDEHARQAVSACTGAQTLARQNLTVVGQSYELGSVTVFDVLAEQRRYLDVERVYTETLRAAYEARTVLNRALGGVR
jgi:cobalt-zinc-cadmium efflux system outer membrane protein